MSVTHKFYAERAADARRDADAASLDNVRDRHLRAAAAWDAMALRQARVTHMRAETDARKAAALADVETEADEERLEANS